MNSLWGPARDLMGFVGFDAHLGKIQEEVTNQFCQRFTSDKLQQEFYQLHQEKGEKVRTFARLELIYRQLHEKLLE